MSTTKIHPAFSQAALLMCFMLLAPAWSHAAEKRGHAPQGNAYKGSWITNTHYMGKDPHIFLGRALSKKVAKKLGVPLGRGEVISVGATHEERLPGLEVIFGQGAGGSLFLKFQTTTLATSKRTGRLLRQPLAYLGGSDLTVKLQHAPKKLDNKGLLKLVVDKLMSPRTKLEVPSKNAAPYQR